MTYRLSLIILLGGLIFTLSCSRDEPVFTNDVVIEEYPKLAEAIVSRDASGLLSFTDHSFREVRSLSWRALAKSEFENPDSLLETVISLNEHAAWLGLSTHDMSENSMQRIREIYTSEPNSYQGACEIFKRQGGEAELMLILDSLAELQQPGLCTAAAGRIMTYEELSQETTGIIFDAAFTSDLAVVRRNLLYGLYRSTLNRPAADSDLRSRLQDEWLELGPGHEPATDQYMVGILGEQGAELFLQQVSFPKDVHNQQLLIEVIRSIGFDDPLSEDTRRIIMELLSHQNPVVVSEILERLKVLENLDDQLQQHIYYNHVQLSRNAVNVVTALELLLPHGAKIDAIMEKLGFIEDENPYLTNRLLAIYMETEPANSFLEKIEEHMDEGGIRGLHAAQILTDYWIGLEDDDQTDQVRRLMRGAAEAGNSSVVSGLMTLLTDEDLVRDRDYSWLVARYEEAKREENSVTMASFAQALESRFPEHSGDLQEPEAVPFLIPDWGRLNEMGSRPYWHIETEKGEVVIRLDPLSAPFTVSSVDSLTRSGDYDNVAFHRVVPNFVIQGGDVGRGDGIGGPGYRIPTEPSVHSFEREAVGIASSGTDTEGSQYFIMHQWKPHLDADYTQFGTVVRGMDVVDRIQIGDVVKKATISVH